MFRARLSGTYVSFELVVAKKDVNVDLTHIAVDTRVQLVGHLRLMGASIDVARPIIVGASVRVMSTTAQSGRVYVHWALFGVVNNSSASGGGAVGVAGIHHFAHLGVVVGTCTISIRAHGGRSVGGRAVFFGSHGGRSMGVSAAHRVRHLGRVMSRLFALGMMVASHGILDFVHQVRHGEW